MGTCTSLLFDVGFSNRLSPSWHAHASSGSRPGRQPIKRSSASSSPQPDKIGAHAGAGPPPAAAAACSPAEQRKPAHDDDGDEEEEEEEEHTEAPHLSDARRSDLESIHLDDADAGRSATPRPGSAAAAHGANEPPPPPASPSAACGSPAQRKGPPWPGAGAPGACPHAPDWLLRALLSALVLATSTLVVLRIAGGGGAGSPCTLDAVGLLLAALAAAGLAGALRVIQSLRERMAIWSALHAELKARAISRLEDSVARQPAQPKLHQEMPPHEAGMYAGPLRAVAETLSSWKQKDQGLKQALEAEVEKLLAQNKMYKCQNVEYATVTAQLEKSMADASEKNAKHEKLLWEHSNMNNELKGLNKDLGQKVCDLSAQNEIYKEQLCHHKELNDDLRGINSELHGRLRDLSLQNDTYKRHNMKHEALNASLGEANGKLAAEVEGLGAKNEQYERQIARHEELNRELSGLELNIHGRAGDRTQCPRAHGLGERGQAGAAADVGHCRGQEAGIHPGRALRINGGLAASLEDLEGQNEQYRRQISRHAELNEELGGINRGLKAEVGALSAQMATYRQRNLEHEELNRGLERVNGQLSAQVEALSLQADQHREHNRRQEELNGELRGLNGGLSAQVEALSAQAEAHEQQLRDHRALNQGLERSVEGLSEQVQKYREQVLEHERANAQLRAASAELEARSSRLSEQLERNSAQIQELAGLNAELQGRNESLRLDLAELSSQNSEHRSLNSDLAASLGELKKEMAALSAQSESRRQQNLRYEEQTRQHESLVARLRSQVERQSQQNEAQLQQCRLYEEQVRQQSANCAELQAQVRGLEHVGVQLRIMSHTCNGSVRQAKSLLASLERNVKLDTANTVFLFFDRADLNRNGRIDPEEVSLFVDNLSFLWQHIAKFDKQQLKATFAAQGGVTLEQVHDLVESMMLEEYVNEADGFADLHGEASSKGFACS